MIKTEASTLLQQYIENPSLRRHCEMVALAMEAYAKKLEQNSEDWYIAGLLHDLDWEKYPDEHPNKACNEILPTLGISEEIINAIRAHAPERTGKQPKTLIEKYLFACDELSGFMDAVAKIRPNGFEGMKWSSVNKKLKNSAFAAAVPRADIQLGAELIGVPLNEHVDFLIGVFSGRVNLGSPFQR